ncbi:divergent polysaccharide deacetylase family protein [Endosaccharibacter trunci]|uniref:divergent polysaccharide deacetylase family protein n=1 Tax=Endosaccharibacter trunci TaxID=2812733 RepID=UPI003BF4A591
MHPAGRALIAFWIGLLLLAGGGGAVLWWLGPPQAAKPRPVQPGPVQPGPVPAVAHAAAPAKAASTTGSGTTPAAAHSAAPVSLAVASPLPALQEPAPGLPGRTLPIIGPDGRMPAEAYASHAGLPANGPQIAILLEGLGLSDAVDQQAVDTLPAPISFAVSPYSDALERSATPPLLDQARRNGHELWLSVPMEPAGSPADMEGGRALSLNLDLAKDRDLLIWCLSRFPGYVGLTNALGGLRGDRFASSSAFSIVADAVRQRGLVYIDAGLAPHDQPAIVPPRTHHADLSIDDNPDASDIQARLSRLEQIAQQNGSALGVAGPLRPVTIERLRSWSRTLHERGITLVPVSALPPPHPGPADQPAPVQGAPVQNTSDQGVPAPPLPGAGATPATAPIPGTPPGTSRDPHGSGADSPPAIRAEPLGPAPPPSPLSAPRGGHDTDRTPSGLSQTSPPEKRP